MFSDIYRNKTVLVTGHTGFKGSWLCLWLENLGANCVGYSLKPPTQPNHFDLINLGMTSITGDIRDRTKLFSIFDKHKPEIVFHLAAQPIVRRSYTDPVETFETNVIGSVNILESCRVANSVRALVNITSDKCYENSERVYRYKESDPMGGYDPYSASKGCSELVTSSYRRSFFNTDDYAKNHNTLVASARAGNIIGGGDWSQDRLVPDIIKATVRNEKVCIRNPKAIRPWQYVLDPLYGYLMLGQKLLEGNIYFADAWNFGPDEENHIEVEKFVQQMQTKWDKIEYKIEENNLLHEAKYLHLDRSKARKELKWSPLLGFEKAVNTTINWYKEYYENGNVISGDTLDEYLNSIKH